MPKTDITDRLRAEVRRLCPDPTPQQLVTELAALEARYQQMKAEDHAELERRFLEVVGDVRTR